MIAGGLTILMAIAFDLLLLGAQRLLAPWRRPVQGGDHMSAPSHLGFLGVFGTPSTSSSTSRRRAPAQTLVGGPDQVLHLTGQHLKVTFLALGLATAIALPTGVVLGHIRKGEAFAISLGNAGRAVPELALIAFVAAFIGVGLLNVTLAFAVLGIPPILTNAYVGVSQVDRNAVEAARGMGMSALQVIRRVELPWRSRRSWPGCAPAR